VAINLSKGQKISLEKTAPKLSKIALGLAWQPIAPKGFFGRVLKFSEAVDLDASCVCLDARGKEIDVVWFRKLESTDRAIRHSGDNRTGEGDGDDETLSVNLGQLDPRVSVLMFTINSFSGQSFVRVKSSTCRLIDAQSRQTLARFELDAQGEHTALVMAALTRKGADWEMNAIGQTGYGSTYRDLSGPIGEWIKYNYSMGTP
jgi:tellurium resistance protein TerZ